jgi:hypothetical protein
MIAGNILIFIDADLQNNLEDIPHLLAKLEEGRARQPGKVADRLLREHLGVSDSEFPPLGTIFLWWPSRM